MVPGRCSGSCGRGCTPWWCQREAVRGDGGNPGTSDGARSDGVGGSRRMAHALAMRLDAQPDFLHADVAYASPASPMRRRCGAVPDPIYSREEEGGGGMSRSVEEGG
eukprot:5969813-Pyramimonas_sp.AAC.1